MHNAKLYQVGSGDNVIDVVHLWGTPYEMGKAHAEIANASVTALIDKVWSYLEGQVSATVLVCVCVLCVLCVCFVCFVCVSE